MERIIKIFDTTLRDGEQSPGCSMDLKEKIQMAKQLENLKVDVIEAGFAAASVGDLESIREVSKVVENCKIASLARANKDDIDKAWESLSEAKHPRIHTFIATSPIHMEYKLKMTPEEVLKQVEEMVAYAKSYCEDVEFSAEDATRTEIGFLVKVVKAAIKSGAKTINIPDTVGYTTPDEFYKLLTTLMERCPELKDVDLSVHCHNDLGLGVANSIAAVKAGANQIECTVNGIGERAGNAALEEIVMALETRKDAYGVSTNIETKQIYRSSQLLTRITGVKVQPNKAIVGENAFAHEAGIHQHGVLNNKETYEIMTPESIGLNKNKLVLGKHSGRHAFKDKIESMGYKLNTEEINEAFKRFKEVADKKKDVFDRDIDAIISRQTVGAEEKYKLIRFVINSGNSITATAAVKILVEGEEIEKVAIGDGPIDAAFNAIEGISGTKLKLEDYSLSSVTEGKDALGDAVVKLRENGSIYVGRGLSTDVVEASVKAYINALNKMNDSKNIKIVEVI